MKTLIMGAGVRTNKMVWLSGQTKEFEGDVVRVDMNPDVKPDVLWDLRDHPLPFSDNEFDEIHAYHVLEHLAQQGDYEFFFSEFNEYHRILKPDGCFFGITPAPRGIWAWGDPGHTRMFPKEYLIFLDRRVYNGGGDENPITDYRFCYDGNFERIHEESGDGLTFAFIIKAIK